MQDDMNHELTKYVEDHISPQPEYLSRIERQTNLRLLNGRMCSGLLQGRLLKMIVEMIRPERVLELGTFSGFSALCIAEALKGEATLDTIEIDDELEDFIRRNLSSSECGERVTLHIGAAEDVVKKWNPATFDLIFIDADKRRYSRDFDLCLPLLRKGGFIIADNTLWDGHVVDPAKEKDPQTRGIREFNDMIRSRTDIESVILPLRDGLTIIRKK
jgi:predicted O-methyltransferase YrrM